MPFITLRASFLEDQNTRLFSLFELSDEPSADCIVRFEECLSKHGRTAVAVVRRRVRVPLSSRADLDSLRAAVEGCINDANLEQNSSED